MRSAGRGEAKLGQDSRYAQGGDGPARLGPDYTPSDAAQFEMLADFSHVGGGLGADRQALPASPAFEYTAGDARAFDRLMGLLADGPGKAHPARHGTPVAAGYTESDNRLFDRLMSSDSLEDAAAARDAHGGAADQAPAEGAFHYTRRDIEAFQKIMPDPSAPNVSTEDGRQSPERGGGPSRSDRDVGHIRIVDFDQQHAQRKESEKHGTTNIKIRYFD